MSTYQGGFEVTYNEQGATLNLRAWGFWSLEVATKFGARVQDVLRRVTNKVRLRAEFTGYFAQRPEVQDAQLPAWRVIAARGLMEGVCWVPEPIARLQLRRIFEANNLSQCIFVADQHSFAEFDREEPLSTTEET